MFIEFLSLTDFRSHEQVDLPLEPGVNIFMGQNGQGKTNLVEAVEYLSTLGSHRVSSEAPLVRFGAEQAIVRGRVRAGRDDARSLLLEVEINPGKANRLRINKAPQQRPRDLLGVLRTVLFSPEDLTIVKGDPSDRRTFIDQVVITRWPRMAGVRADFDKVLRQRNTLLKQVATRRAENPRSSTEDDEFTLEIFDDQLAAVAAELLLARLDTLAELTPLASEYYQAIAPMNNQITAEYRSSIDLAAPEDEPMTRQVMTARLKQAMVDRRREELQRGVSLVGPHRDEIVLSIGQLPAKGYASHGESWSLALSLKLASFELVRRDGIDPVLILDDVFAELDTVRRQRLADAVAKAEQVLVTAAVGADVPESLGGLRYRIQRDQPVVRDEGSPGGAQTPSDAQTPNGGEVGDD